MISKISSGIRSNEVLSKNPQKVITHQKALNAPVNDTVSFGAIHPAAKLANSQDLAKAITAAREYVGKKGKEASNLVSSAVNEVINNQKDGESIKKLATKNNSILTSLQSVAKEATESVDGKSQDAVVKAMKIVDAAIDDYSAVEGGKILKNSVLHKFLNMANTNQAVFDALFALGLAGVLRPATIYALPSKNKDDNAYAAGHSISSGLIGFGIALLVNSPIANAIKHVKNNATDYLKPETIKQMGNIVDGQLVGKNFDIATRYINMSTKLGLAIPQACLTVALVPVFLKKIFGLEKGKPKASKQEATTKQSNNDNNDKKISFSGSAVDSKKLSLGQKILTKFVGAFMNNKLAQKIVDKTSKSDINIVKHLSALNGLIISGMYVTRTLKNDKLDPERKSTLAINQAAVAVVSTILGYTFDKAANKKIDKLIEKFQAANISKGAEKLAEYSGGVKAAASLIIFSTVYRYLSPVLVTPLANKLGSLLNNNKNNNNKV